MNNVPSRPRFSFQTKVLVPVVAMMVLLIATTIWLVDRRIGAQVRDDASDQLLTASKIVRKSQQIRVDNLKARFRNVVNEPRFKAAAQLADMETANDFLDRLLGEFDGQDGAAIATLEFTRGEGEEFASASHAPGIDRALFQARCQTAIREAVEDRQPKADTIIVGNHLVDVVSLPVIFNDQIVGVATFGVEIGVEAAREIKQLTRTEIFFMTGDHVAVGSLPKPELYPVLVARFSSLAGDHKSPNSGAALQIIVNDQHFLCKADMFTIPGGTGKLEYLLLYSYESGIALLSATQKMLVAVGLLGIALSVTLAWLLVRKLTQPLRLLRDSAEAVGKGDFSRRVEVSSRDECGELAVVFNRMTENLKTSREELEKTVETLKTTQHQLIQSEKLSGIGEFVAGVAHELNNPLTSVMGFAELMQQNEMQETQRRFLDMIFKSAKRCQKIVQSLLSFARRHAPERKVVCVNEILESAVEILAYQMRASNIEVVTNFDPRLPATMIDPHQMQQVFLNIINNAKQAMEDHQPSGRMQITTAVVNGKVRITFQDNGPGISVENLTKIFNPFFTTKEVGKGTGLGLSLCYGIITEHGGTITPDSAPGKGATFTIELPITAEAVAKSDSAATAPAPNARDGVGRRVLVIDDEDAILQMIEQVLTIHGYKVDVVRDGETALKRLAQYHYDLALCDWKMPGLNGEQVYERLNAANPDMSRRLIFITGDIVNQRTQEFLKASDKICLSKPFTLTEFRSAISRIVPPPKAAST
jgi:two-component system, NtrC family, sensor kinase